MHGVKNHFQIARVETRVRVIDSFKRCQILVLMFSVRLLIESSKQILLTWIIIIIVQSTHAKDKFLSRNQCCEPGLSLKMKSKSATRRKSLKK